MPESFEGMFGPQEEFPVGNRDKDIDEAIETIKAGPNGAEFNFENIGMLSDYIMNALVQKYGIDENAETGPAAERADKFLGVYDPDYIRSRLDSYFFDLNKS